GRIQTLPSQGRQGGEGGRRFDVCDSLRADDVAVRQHKSRARQIPKANRISPAGAYMTGEVKKLTIQVRASRGTFPGEVVEGWYCVVDNAVVLTDAEGKPIDSEKHQLAPDEDARLLACRLVRGRRRNSSGAVGFNDRIIYPKNFY